MKISPQTQEILQKVIRRTEGDLRRVKDAVRLETMHVADRARRVHLRAILPRLARGRIRRIKERVVEGNNKPVWPPYMVADAQAHALRLESTLPPRDRE